MNQITANMLTAGETYLVRGKVGFSRITRQTTDVERNNDNARRRYPVTTNYTNISIYNAQVLMKDPQNPTVEERYAQERLYQSSSPNLPGANFSAMNKTSNLPAVAVIQGPNNYAEIVPEHELAAGLDVTLVMRVFKPTGQMNQGVSLDRILVNEPIRYFHGRNINNDLAAYGITYQAMAPTSPTPEDYQAEAAAAVSAESNFNPQTQVQPQVTYSPAGQPAMGQPIGQPVPQMTAQPAMGQPVPQMATQPAQMGQPVGQPAAPVTPFSYSGNQGAEAPMGFEPGQGRQY